MTTVLPPVLAVVAHQDDFELVMGVMARNHREHDRTVKVVCLGTGTGSGVQAQLAMSDAEFTAYRDDEQQRAARALGIPYPHIHLPYGRAPGGTLTAADAQDRLAAFLSTYGLWNASVKTYSDKAAPGRHPEHAAVGQAVRALADAGSLVAPRFYIEPWGAIPQAFADTHAAVRVSREYCTGVEHYRAALREYMLQDPHGWKLGIGGRSVPDVFAELLARPTPYNLYHT